MRPSRWLRPADSAETRMLVIIQSPFGKFKKAHPPVPREPAGAPARGQGETCNRIERLGRVVSSFALAPSVNTRLYSRTPAGHRRDLKGGFGAETDQSGPVFLETYDPTRRASPSWVQARSAPAVEARSRTGPNVVRLFGGRGQRRARAEPPRDFRGGRPGYRLRFTLAHFFPSLDGRWRCLASCSRFRPFLFGVRAEKAQKKRPAVKPDALLKWSGRRDSNSRRPPWQGGALPTELRPQNRVLGLGSAPHPSTAFSNSFSARR